MIFPERGAKLAGVFGSAELNIVVDGDSNTDVGNNANNWSVQLSALFVAAGYPDPISQNYAVGGSTWDDLAARSSTTDAAASGDYNVLLLAAGTNNFWVDSDTAASAIADAQSYVSAAVTAGVWDKIALLTIPPITGETEMDANVDTFNAALSGLTGVDFIIDRRLSAALDTSGGAPNYEDILHYSTAGHAILAGLAYDALRANL